MIWFTPQDKRLKRETDRTERHRMREEKRRERVRKGGKTAERYEVF